MICFPNAKINLGLNIISKRSDGFHNIETIFYPIGLNDVLEFVDNKTGKTEIKTTGIGLDISDDQNICMKAYQLLSKDYSFPPIDIYLHKVIPSGAGLGGGSSDAAFFIKGLNSHFKLNLSDNQLENYAIQLGSDCSFFIKNKAVFATGRGEIFEQLDLDLSGYFIYLVKPEIFVSTLQAYTSVAPLKPDFSIKESIQNPIENWKNRIFNDFEKNVFQLFPELEHIKMEIYRHGAVYASMSGSGSSIYGIFKNEPEKIEKFGNYFNWISKL
jgi:4-diphosphocytidyl-2-C-methyl-D-erythritol kinase